MRSDDALALLAESLDADFDDVADRKLGQATG